MIKDDCLFCKIAEHKIPSSIVYEDDDVMAFLDISQTTKGHTLVIPKQHYDCFLATPIEVVTKVLNIAQKIGIILMHDFKAKGINILMNNYEAAGQTVMHFHVHVIPRYMPADGFSIEMKENDNVKDINLPALANDIKSKL